MSSSITTIEESVLLDCVDLMNVDLHFRLLNSTGLMWWGRWTGKLIRGRLPVNALLQIQAFIHYQRTVQVMVLVLVRGLLCQLCSSCERRSKSASSVTCWTQRTAFISQIQMWHVHRIIVILQYLLPVCITSFCLTYSTNLCPWTLNQIVLILISRGLSLSLMWVMWLLMDKLWLKILGLCRLETRCWLWEDLLLSWLH